MTRKFISVTLVLLLVFATFTACAKKADTPTVQTESAYSPISILAGALAQYKADDVVFNVSLDMVVDLKENSDFLQSVLYIPQDQMANITGAATMMHMNQNSFTGAALEMKEGVDIAAFCETMRNTILQTQWFCGFPDKLLVATVNDRFVVIAYGLDDASAPLLSTFRDRLLQAHGESAVNIRYLDTFQ